MSNVEKNSNIKFLVLASDGQMKLYDTLNEAVHSPFCHGECSIWRVEHEFNCHVVQGMLFFD